MKIYKYQYIMLNATYDPYIVYHNMVKHYPDVQYYNPFDSSFIGKPSTLRVEPLDGIRIEKVFSGITHVKQDGIEHKFELEVNVEIFSERTLLYDMILDIEGRKTFETFLTHEKEKESPFGDRIFTWKTDGKTVDSSIIAIVNDFITTKIFPFSTDGELIQLHKDTDPTEKESIARNDRKLKEMIGITIEKCGQNMGTNSAQRIPRQRIILDQKREFDINDKSWEKISDNYDLYKSDSLALYVAFTEKDCIEFIKDFKNNHLYEAIIGGYTVNHNMWSTYIGKLSQELLDNLDNENEVYWRNLRLKVEEFQLHFLKQNTQRKRSFSSMQQLKSFNSIDVKTSKEWQKVIDKSEQGMFRYIDDLKYDLDNLATPGHTHDEQTLQRETEKTNERILLLSFLAMSIPMMGAIFSPNFSLYTKILSAMVLCMLPMVYFSVFRLSRMRRQKLDRKRDLTRKKENWEAMLDWHKNNLEEIKNDTKIAEDLKENVIQWELQNISVGESMLDKIKKKIK